MWVLVALFSVSCGLGCERITPATQTEEIKVIDLAPPALVSPKNGRVITTTNRITLRWRATFGASSYAVQVSRSAAFNEVLLVAQVDTTALTTTLERGFVYYWKVMSLIPPNYGSAWSDPWSFRLLREGEVLFD